MRLLPAIAALCLLLCAGHARGGALTLDDLLSAEDLGAVGFDPAERWMVVERRRAYDAAPAFDTEAAITIGRTDLLRLDLTRSGQVEPLLPSLTDGGYKAGPFSPDGAFLLVYRMAGETWDAGIVTMATGEVRWLGLSAELPVLGRAAQWRTGRELLLIVRADGDLPLDLRRGRQAPERIGQGWRTTAAGSAPAVTAIGSGAFLGLRPRTPPMSLVRVDAVTGAARALAKGEFDDLEISPSGSQVALVRQEEDLQPKPGVLVRVGDATRRRNVLLLDLGRETASIPCPSCDVAPLLLTWSPRGDQLLVYARGAGQTWSAGQLTRLVFGSSPRPVAPAVARPELEYTSDGIAYVRAGWMGDHVVAPRQIGLGAESPEPRTELGDGARQLVNPATPARARQPGELPAGAEPLALGRTLTAFRVRDRRGVETLGLIDAPGSRRDLLVLNGALAERDPPDIVPVIVEDPSGTARTSWLYLPHDRATGARLPLVVLPYPGVSYATAPLSYGSGPASLQSSPYLLAARGYAALVPSLPRDRDAGEPAVGLGAQVLAIVDSAIATGAVDPDRLALWGHSFGGYGALTISGQTDRFGSVIAKAAVVDLQAFRGAFIPHHAAAPEDGYALNFGTGWTELGQGRLRVGPDRNPERYRRNSPVGLAERIHAPVLLIAGDQDEVPIGQSQAMFAALYRQGKDAELVTYWGERHLISSPANLRDLYGRVFAWLDLTLDVDGGSPGSPRRQARPGFTDAQRGRQAASVAPPMPGPTPPTSPGP